MIEFYGAPGSQAAFDVQIWKLKETGQDAQAEHTVLSASAPETLVSAAAGGPLVYTISEIDVEAYNRLGLVVTRLDSQEDLDPVGAYTIALHPGSGQAAQGRSHVTAEL
jgi:hypothetical protein